MRNRWKRKDGALSHHKKVGKRFIPPLLQNENVVETSWIDIGIPELVWIALLLDSYGLKEAAELTTALVKAYAKVRGESWYACLNTLQPNDPDELTRIATILKEEGVWDALRKPLLPLTIHYPDSPLSFLGPDKSLSDRTRLREFNRLKRVLATLYDRASREATLTQALAIYLGGMLGIFQFPESPFVAHFEKISEYPKTPISQVIASSIRAMITAIIGQFTTNGESSWLTRFWNQGLNLDRCYVKFEAVRGEAPESIDPRMSEICSRYAQNVKRDFEERIRQWKPEHSKREIQEVIGGLLSRQVTVALELAQSPICFNGHIAPVLLRSMADTLISIAWILRSPKERCKQYRLYGLGQEKLFVENLKQTYSGENQETELARSIEFLERDLGTEYNPHFTEVNVGSWSGISTREMATEIEYEDLYKFGFSFFSSAAHSTWQHVRKSNVTRCLNPLHGYHLVPLLVHLPFDPLTLHTAARYVDQTFGYFDESQGIAGPSPSAFDILIADMRQLIGNVESQEERSTSE